MDWEADDHDSVRNLKGGKTVKACMEATGHVNEEPYEASLDNYGCCDDGPKSGRLRATNNVSSSDEYFVQMH
ncbi:hypothetical protein ACFX11_035930 [Malus domestica]